MKLPQQLLSCYCRSKEIPLLLKSRKRLWENQLVATKAVKQYKRGLFENYKGPLKIKGKFETFSSPASHVLT
jgi:hypothetical protein